MDLRARVKVFSQSLSPLGFPQDRETKPMERMMRQRRFPLSSFSLPEHPPRIIGCGLLFAVALGPTACKKPPNPSQDPTQYSSRLQLHLPANTPASRRQNVHRVWPWVRRYARRYHLDPQLVLAIIWVESRYDLTAKSHAGARGLMQLMPRTARSLAQKLELRQRPLNDPAYNIQLGCYYLARLLRRFKGRRDLALAAYNAGPTRVKRWHRSGALPQASRNYARSVLRARSYFTLPAPH